MNGLIEKVIRCGILFRQRITFLETLLPFPHAIWTYLAKIDKEHNMNIRDISLKTQVGKWVDTSQF